jgi:hypothetical protein
MSTSHIGSVSSISPPDTGKLSPELLSTLCAVLAEYTKTRDACFFCIWEGHGWLPGKDSGGDLVFTASADIPTGRAPAPMRPSPVPPPFPMEVTNQPKIILPFRNYFLFEGPLKAAYQFGWRLGEDTFISESPNLFWPQDHSWCVASEIDLYCTLVAGSEAMADAIITHPHL